MRSSTEAPPHVCFVGKSGSGKTTIVSKVIAHLARAGLRVGALKHSSHAFQMDREGKDTYQYRAAGAYAIGIASKTERALIVTTEGETPLTELIGHLPPGLDCVIVEGYKSEGAPKLEVQRGESRLLSDGGDLTNLIGVITDRPAGDELLAGLPADTPRFGHDELDGLCAFLRSFLGV